MATALTPLANITLAAGQSTITFSSISGSYRDLRLVGTGGFSSYSNLLIRLNSDSGTNYSWVLMEANGTSAYGGYGSSAGMADSYNIWVDAIGTGANTGVYQLDLFDYAQTDKHKSALLKITNSVNGLGVYAQRWANTSAVTSITLVAGGNWNVGTNFALYGVSA